MRSGAALSSPAGSENPRAPSAHRRQPRRTPLPRPPREAGASTRACGRCVCARTVAPLSTSGLLVSTRDPPRCENRRRARAPRSRPRISCASRSDSLRGGAPRSASASAGSTTGSCSSSARRAPARRSSPARSARSRASSTSARSRRSRPRSRSSPRFHRDAAAPAAPDPRRLAPRRARRRGSPRRADARAGVPRTRDPARVPARRASSTSFATAATSSARCSRSPGFAASRRGRRRRGAVRRVRAVLGRARAPRRVREPRATRGARPGCGGAT